MSNNKSALSGSIALAGDFEIDGLLIGTASWAIKAQTSSFFDGASIEVADLRVTNTASIEYLNVVYQSSSVIYSSGSNIFGDSPSDTQTLHGTVIVENDLQVAGNTEIQSLTVGDINGTNITLSGYLIASAIEGSPSFELGSGTIDNLTVESYLEGNLVGNADSATFAQNAEASNTAISASHALQSDSSVSASHALIADNLANPLSLADVLAVGNTGDNITLSGEISAYSLNVVGFNLDSGDINNVNIGGTADIGQLEANSISAGDITADSLTLYSGLSVDGALNANGGVVGNLTGNADTATSASHALVADVASYVENAQTASYFLTSSVTSASLAQTASYVKLAQSASWAAGVASIRFGREIHASWESGNDSTGDGSLNRPYKTANAAYNAAAAGGGDIIVLHRGIYAEDLTVTKPNLSFIGAETAGSGLVEINGTFTVNIASAAPSTRIDGMRIKHLVHQGSGSLYGWQINVLDSYTKSGPSAYSDFLDSEFQCTSGSLISGPGVVMFQAGKQFPVVVNNANAQVLVKDSSQVVAPNVLAGALTIQNSIVFPLASGSAAVTSAAGTFVQIWNSSVVTSLGLPERVNIGGFFGYDDVQFNKALSTLGTQLGVKAYFQSLDANLLTATGSLFGTASWSVNSKNAQTASYIDSQNLVLSNLTITNTASISYLDVRYQSSSIIYSSGSNIFGDAADDVQTLHGQVNVINDLSVDGGLTVQGDAEFGDISTANITAGDIEAGDLVASTGAFGTVETTDLIVNGAATFNAGLTGNLTGNADTATSASHALIANDLVNIPSLQAITTAGNSTSQSISIGVDIEMGAAGTLLNYTYVNGQFALVSPPGLRFSGLYGTPPDVNFFVVGNKYTVVEPGVTGPDNTFVLQVTGITPDLFGGYTVDGTLISGNILGTGFVSITTFASPAEYAFGQGQGIKVSANSQHVVGLWNSPVTGSGAFVVGNGSDDANRSNLIEASGNSITFNGAINFLNLPSYSNDADAATGGVAIGGIYRNGNFIQIRIS